jgi:hypothetical protein
MLSDKHAAADEVCPISDELLGELYRASRVGLPVLGAAVPPDVRASLAIFCYRRSHLHEVGLAIAATCDEEDLVKLGGMAGAALFARSRTKLNPSLDAPHSPHRRKITLATGCLRYFAPIPDDSPAAEFSDSPPERDGCGTPFPTS